MKRNRIVFLLLWIMSLVGISFYGGSVSYGFFIVLSAIPVVSLFYIVFVIFRFKIYQRLDSRNLISNRTSDFFFTLQNESLISFAGIRVSFYSDFSTISGLDDMTEYELSPHTGIKKQTGLVCRYRGEYEVGINRIIVQDFFRLFSIAYRNPEPLRVRIKPDIVSLSQLRTDAENFSSAKDARTHINDADVLTREYQPTDDKRMINWKATAAAQKLMVRERTGSQQQGIGIIMDTKRCSQRPEEYLPTENRILETVIALTLYYCSRNTQVDICYYTGELNEITVNDTKQFDGFYEQISDVSFYDEYDPQTLFEKSLCSDRIAADRAVYYVTYMWDEKTAVFAKELSRRGFIVTLYVITDGNIPVTDINEIPRCSITAVPPKAELAEVI